MNQIISVFALVFFVWGSALAADSGCLVLPAKGMGDVQFNHAKHQQMLKDCTICHATKQGGTIPGFGKEKAHKLCWDCHKTKSNGKGPTASNCKGCHKK